MDYPALDGRIRVAYVAADAIRSTLPQMNDADATRYGHEFDVLARRVKGVSAAGHLGQDAGVVGSRAFWTKLEDQVEAAGRYFDAGQPGGFDLRWILLGFGLLGAMLLFGRK